MAIEPVVYRESVYKGSRIYVLPQVLVRAINFGIAVITSVLFWLYEACSVLFSLIFQFYELINIICYILKLALFDMLHCNASVYIGSF